MQSRRTPERPDERIRDQIIAGQRHGASDQAGQRIPCLFKQMLPLQATLDQRFACRTLGNRISHLARTGVLVNNRLRCFAHGACFRVDTGDIEEHPGHGHLPSEGTVVYV